MRLVTSAVVLACVAGVSGCAEPTSSPVAPRPAIPRLSASVAQQTTGLHPNRVKYRDAGFHPATGRSGSAVVSARALLDKAGTTTVEVTTGSFDEGAAPGTLAKVQLKAFGPSGQLAFTDNHDAATATVSYPYTTLPHGTTLQVQNVVRGIDPSRTDVVTLSTAVYFRPDLAAWRLDAPDNAPIGTPVNIQGLITENNGEVGARTDCVLYIDGTPVDRANGIWVDAAGFVGCAMTHVFTEARSYALELRLENVGPGDFDVTNNSATTSINIVTPSPFRFYSFQAWDITDISWWHSVSTLETWEGNLETWDQVSTRDGRQQFATFSALIPAMLDYNAPITLRGEMRTNGGIVSSVEITYPSLPFSDWQQGYCGSNYDIETREATYICVLTEGHAAGHTNIQYDWSAANIRYHSESYVYYWDPSGQLHEAYYVSEYTDATPLVTMGPDFSGRFSVQAAADAEPMTIDATVQFEPTDLYFEYVDPLCSTSNPAPPGCFELHGHTFGQFGYVDYGSWPPFIP